MKGEHVRAFGKNWVAYPNADNYGSKYYKCFIPLHVYTWEIYHGCPVPENYEVHHIDHDKNNNVIENLIAIPVEEHRRIHSSYAKANHVERLIELARVGREAAKKWRATEEGKKRMIEMSSQNGKLIWEQAYKIKRNCNQCGKEYETYNLTESHSKYCSENCKAKYRRKIGADNETRKCVFCGKDFETNKYKKTKTCSRSCSQKERAKQAGNSRYKGNCLQCGCEIWIYPSYKEHTKFCSRTCKDIYQTGKHR